MRVAVTLLGALHRRFATIDSISQQGGHVKGKLCIFCSFFIISFKFLVNFDNALTNQFYPALLCYFCHRNGQKENEKAARQTPCG